MNTGDEAPARPMPEEGPVGASPPCKALPLPRAGAKLWGSLGETEDDGDGAAAPLGGRGLSPHPWGFTGQGWISGSVLAGRLPAAPSELLLAKSHFLLFPA